MNDFTKNPDYPIDNLLHRLWTKAVGTPDYDKAEWKQLEAFLNKKIYTKRTLNEITPELVGRLGDIRFDGRKKALDAVISAIGDRFCLHCGHEACGGHCDNDD